MVALDTVRDTFTQQLPAMRSTARKHFAHLNPEASQEAVTNAVALAWVAFYRLFLQGRAEEPGILNSCVWYAIKQTKVGRTPQGCPRSKDAYTKRRYGKVRFENFDPNEFLGRTTPIPEQVSFRVDIPAFFDTLNDRQRKMAVDLAGGMTTSEAAKKYGLSAGRISQFRREFKTMFDRFFAE